MTTPENFLPKNKHDFERLNALIAEGPSAAEPILEPLLTWLQDINWPIAKPMAEFLVTVGEPLVPHLRKILISGDDIWIYWVLQFVVAKLPSELINKLDNQLYGLASASENDIVAIRIAATAGTWDRKTLMWMINNHISAYESYVVELRELKEKLGVENER